MSNIVFERPRGTSWAAKWVDTWSNLIHSAAAPGFETRVSLGPTPLRQLELAYSILVAGTQGITRDQLLGFFNLRGGDFDSFLVDLGMMTKNPADSAVVGQVLNVDSNGYAAIQRTHAVSTTETWEEDIYELAGVNGNPGTAPVIYLNSVPLVAGVDYAFHGPGYAISGQTFPGLMVIISAAIPASPAGIVTADFTFYYRMRFAQSKLEVEQFHYLLWKAQQIQLVTTRT